MSVEKIPLSKPSMTELEFSYVNDAVRTGWGERCYDYIHRFEAEFASHIGAKHAIATSSCTGALHMGLAAMGIGPGDEVILADTNWVATVAPVVHLGATPVFVDIDPGTWCLDPDQVERAITPQTKAIIAVHLYGNLAPMDRLLEIGRRHQLPVIEDAAEAMGSTFHGARAGSMGAFGVFSFHGSKTLSTGEGGMFVTDDGALHEKVLTLSNHGRVRGQEKQFWPEVVGYKYKISNLQAALGCAQLERIEELVARKREILGYYKWKLSSFEGIQMNSEPSGCIVGAWMPTVVFDGSVGVTSERMIRAFKDHQIDGRVFFHPLSSLTMFGSHGGAPNAASIAGRAVNLPSFHDMTSGQMDRVVSIIEKTLHECV